MSAHGAYHPHYHLGWIPKYRKKVLTGDLKLDLEKGLFDSQKFHPDGEIEKFSRQIAHVHLLLLLPPPYAVSASGGKLTANTSREMRARVPWLRKIYGRNEFWSVGFFSAPVGSNVDVIKRYVEFQEKVDTGQLPLDCGF